MAVEAPNRATAIGLEQVINAWKAINDGLPFFAIYYNKTNKWFQYSKDDLNGAEQFLRDNLQAVEEAGDSAMYYLNVYDSSQRNYANTGMVGSFPFRLNPYQPVQSQVGGISETPQLLAFMQKAHDKQMEMQEKLFQAKYENQPMDTWDRIGALLETPGTVNAIVPVLTPIIAGLTNILSKIAGIEPGSYPTAKPAINGVPQVDEQKEAALDDLLDRLEKHGDLLDILGTLANFADKNPETFKSYFQLLKAQG